MDESSLSIKKASTFERIDGRPQLLFSNKMSHKFKEWTTESGTLKKKIFPLQKCDTQNIYSLQYLFTKTAISQREIKAQFSTPKGKALWRK